MSVRMLTPKEIKDLENELRILENVATKRHKKPRLLTNVEDIENLNLALNLAGLTLSSTMVAIPPTTLTLTPAYPTTPDGNNLLMFRTQGAGWTTAMGILGWTQHLPQDILYFG